MISRSKKSGGPSTPQKKRKSNLITGYSPKNSLTESPLRKDKKSKFNDATSMFKRPTLFQTPNPAVQQRVKAKGKALVGLSPARKPGTTGDYLAMMTARYGDRVDPFAASPQKKSKQSKEAIFRRLRQSQAEDDAERAEKGEPTSSPKQGLPVSEFLTSPRSPQEDTKKEDVDAPVDSSNESPSSSEAMLSSAALPETATAHKP